MAWVLDRTDATNVYWRREEDGYVIGFNRRGVGEPWSDTTAPPADIDKYAEPMSASAVAVTMDALSKKLADVESEIAELKKGKG